MNYVLAGVLGGVVAAGILLIQHYKIDRAKLKRQHAYVLGVAGLDTGFLVFALVAGLDFRILAGLAVVEAIAGGSLLLAYKVDKNLPPPKEGQLQEALNQNEDLRKEVSELNQVIAGLQEVLVSGPVTWGQLLDMFSPMHTAIGDLVKVQSCLEASSAVYYKLQKQADKHVAPEIKRANAARAAKKKESPDGHPGK